MKQLRLASLLASLFIIITHSVSANEADKILGTYMTEDNKGKVVITKQDNQYFGTLVWTYIPEAKDEFNPDKSKRTHKLEGLVVLKNLSYSGKDTWSGGTVYDPESGKTYSGTITLNKDGSLNMRGYVGVSMFGRTSVWTRVADEK